MLRQSILVCPLLPNSLVCFLSGNLKNRKNSKGYHEILPKSLRRLWRIWGVILKNWPQKVFWDSLMMLQSIVKKGLLSLFIYRCSNSIKHYALDINHFKHTYAFGIAQFDSIEELSEHFKCMPVLGSESGKFFGKNRGLGRKWRAAIIEKLSLRIGKNFRGKSLKGFLFLRELRKQLYNIDVQNSRFF